MCVVMHDGHCVYKLPPTLALAILFLNDASITVPHQISSSTWLQRLGQLSFCLVKW